MIILQRPIAWMISYGDISIRFLCKNVQFSYLNSCRENDSYVDSNTSWDTIVQQIDTRHIRTGLGMYFESSQAVSSTIVLAFMKKEVTFWHSGTG